MIASIIMADIKKNEMFSSQFYQDIPRLLGLVKQSDIDNNKSKLSSGDQSVIKKEPIEDEECSNWESDFDQELDQVKKEAESMSESELDNDQEAKSSSKLIKKEKSTRSAKEWIFPGSTVLSRWSNGLYYLGVILEVDILKEQVLVQYEDNSTHWMEFKDIHKQLSQGTIMADLDILCVNCNDGTSHPPNEIVICDVCNQGYHQRCHKPRIPNSVLEPNVPWSCRLCVFALATKEGGAEKVNTKLGFKLKQVKTCLPYDLSRLNWDEKHQTNCQNTYCYCGGPGEYFSKMLQCQKCSQWFHEACIQCLDSPLLYGDHYYVFKCGICNSGNERVKRIIMKWSDVVSLVLHNLSLQHGRRYFDLQAEMVPFIQEHCHMIKLSEDLSILSKEQLADKINSILANNPTKFMTSKDSRKSSNWALRPFQGPLIFAPPTVITSSSSAPSVPIIYGACRKRASFSPLKPKQLKHSLSKHHKAVMTMRRSNSVTSLTSNCSATSGLSETTTSSDGSSLQTGKPSFTAVKRMRSKSNNDVETLYSHTSLEAIIPLPENFEGKNNPFYDIALESSSSPKKSKY